jgi:hypothetical protein
MNHASASGLSVLQTVNLIRALKPHDCIIGQSTAATMDCMTKQMAQMVAQVKTTAWGGLHGSFALVLNNKDYQIVSKKKMVKTTRIGQPAVVHPDITSNSTPFETLSYQETQKMLPKAFNLQEAVTTISVQCIINSVEENVSNNSTKSTLNMPIRPSSPCSHTYAQIGARL